jgi:hypothetical protein
MIANPEQYFKLDKITYITKVEKLFKLIADKMVCNEERYATEGDL